MDIYKEQLVKKLPDSTDKMKQLCLVVMTVSLAFAVFFLTFWLLRNIVLSVILAGLTIYGGSTLISNQTYEYEYIFTNGEMDVDKIIAKKTRKRLCTVRVSAFTAFGKYSEDVKLDDSYSKFIFVDGTGTNDYYAEFKHSEHGDSYLFFTPDEEMLECIKKALPRNLK